MNDGNKCTIVWYVDDNKMSHVDPNVITAILKEIKKHFVDLVISRGDPHDFLGMYIKIRNEKNVELMTKYRIEDTVSQFKYICDFMATFLCAQHLLGVND